MAFVVKDFGEETIKEITDTFDAESKNYCHVNEDCMNQKDIPLVSIITPCYNGERFLCFFFKGILSQDYRKIELIFVDDGSTDATEEIAKCYGEEIIRQGMQFIYIKQEHKGQAAAINQGLAVFNGDFLAWTDADDIMSPSNISTKVKFLQEHKDYGFAISGIQFVDEKQHDKIVGSAIRKQPKGDDNIFEDYIYGKNVVWGPGTVLVRRSCVLEAIPDRRIYESVEGQNWQLMLPLSWKFRCGYVEECLLTCLEHSDSHSHRERSYEELKKREENFIVLCCETINRIPDMAESERDYWCNIIRVLHYKNILLMAGRQYNHMDYKAMKRKVLMSGGDIKLGEVYVVLCLKSGIRTCVNKVKKIFSKI